MSDIKNLAASIRMRLKNIAAVEQKNFDFILMLYMIERFMYRLSTSNFSNNFILKGGLLLYICMKEKARPTKDIDFLAKKIENDMEKIKEVFKEICLIPSEDAIFFEVDSISVEKIKEEQEYEGIRVKVKCYLEKAYKILQFDIGFGDIVVPKPIYIECPVLLDMPHPNIRAYSIESVIAEKFEAMISLSLLNSRMKDFYDIYNISEKYSFDGRVLQEAVFETFQRRGTNLVKNPKIFSSSFYEDNSKVIQWKAFINRLQNKSNIELVEVLIRIKEFLEPIYNVILVEDEFFKKWENSLIKWL